MLDFSNVWVILGQGCCTLDTWPGGGGTDWRHDEDFGSLKDSAVKCLKLDDGGSILERIAEPRVDVETRMQAAEDSGEDLNNENRSDAYECRNQDAPSGENRLYARCWGCGSLGEAVHERRCRARATSATRRGSARGNLAELSAEQDCAMTSVKPKRLVMSYVVKHQQPPATSPPPEQCTQSTEQILPRRSSVIAKGSSNNARRIVAHQAGHG